MGVIVTKISSKEEVGWIQLGVQVTMSRTLGFCAVAVTSAPIIFLSFHPELCPGEPAVPLLH